MRDDIAERMDTLRVKPNGHDAAPALWIDDGDWTEAEIPPRPWVAPGYALRGAVTVVAGPPSAMKSSLMLAWAVALALGKPHGDFRPIEADASLIYNVEDNQTEQRRRLSAVLRQFDTLAAEIRGKIVRVGPAGIGTLFTLDKETGAVLPTAAMTALRALIAERSPAMLIADPLAELHTAEENDNTALRAIVAEFRALAQEFNIAVILVHHTRKGAVIPGDPDSARGASAIIGAGRIVLTLCTMSEDDADVLGLPKDRKTRFRYVRLDDAKQNYAGIGEAQWYEKALYTLDNGEMVPAAVPWQPPNMWHAVSLPIANAILDEIDAGIDGGKQLYSDHPKASDRAAADLVRRHLPELTEEQARQIVKTWIRNSVLSRATYRDEQTRRDRQGLRVNPSKRPGAVAPC